MFRQKYQEVVQGEPGFLSFLEVIYVLMHIYPHKCFLHFSFFRKFWKGAEGIDCIDLHGKSLSKSSPNKAEREGAPWPVFKILVCLASESIRLSQGKMWGIRQLFLYLL